MKFRDNSTNFITRSVYGALFVALIIGAILCGVYGFGLLLALFVVGGTLELYAMCAQQGYRANRLLGTLTSLSLLAFNFDATFLGGGNILYLGAILALLIPSIFVAELFSGSRKPIANVGVTLLGVIYIALPMMMFCNVALLLGGGEWQSLLLVAFFMVIWANDSFAYIVGVTLGKRIMFARISPKKSWEGLFGGIIGAIAMGVCLALLLDQNPYFWGSLSLVAAVAGVLGDLVESMFKRSVEIKDSGNLLPGHGGWLDRFDSLLLAVPVVYAYLLLLSNFDLI